MNKWGVGLTFLLAATSVMAKDIQLLNVSYDPTRELYEQYNKAFSAHWKQQTGDNVVIRQSHGGSGKQALEVANGLQADVLLAWENEAFLSLDEHPGEYEIVVPSVSILCQPTVSVVDEVVDKRGTRDVATEYLNYLYSDEAQKLEAEWYYRPSDQDILKQFEYQGQSNTISELPQDGKWIITNVDLTDISHFGGWTEASKKHFADGGLFDSIYEEKN